MPHSAWLMTQTVVKSTATKCPYRNRSIQVSSGVRHNVLIGKNMPTQKPIVILSSRKLYESQGNEFHPKYFHI